MPHLITLHTHMDMKCTHANIELYIHIHQNYLKTFLYVHLSIYIYISQHIYIYLRVHLEIVLLKEN